MNPTYDYRGLTAFVTGAASGMGLAAATAFAQAGAQVALADANEAALDRKSTRLNSSHVSESRMPSSA